MPVDPMMQNKVKSLLLRGFNKEEIKQLLDLPDHKIIDRCLKESIDMNIDDNSFELYSELQKDLSKLVFTEMNAGKDGNKEKKDPNVILNAIKLQTELQEKKINIKKGRNIKPEKISKDYIRERDQEIAQMKAQGHPDKEIAQRFGISEISVIWAMDRVNLNLPESLLQLGPSLITETRGLPRSQRIKILEQAAEGNWSREQIRDIVNKIRNELKVDRAQGPPPQ
jgi:transposase